jgi:hypothetical protein
VSEPHPPSEEGDQENDRSLLSQAWEVALYAPIGLLVEGPYLLPKLARMGKAHVRNARALGHMAVRQGEAELRRRLADTDNQLVDTLRLLGLVPVAHETRETSDRETGATTPSPDTTTADERAGRDGVVHPDRGATVTVPRTPGGPHASIDETRTAENATRADVTSEDLRGEDLTVDDLAIPEYDSLSAPQVVQRLSGLRRDELEAVRRYELAHRGRKTILNKVAQLQT